MKIIACIVVLYVLFLSIGPGIKSIYFGVKQIVFSGDSHFYSAAHESSENSDDGCGDDCNGNCNPFKTCSNCLGCTICVVPSYSAFVSVQYSDTITSTKQDKLSSKFTSDFWQPPQLT
jgi:hypothetical protein